mmetsp:Transcript_4190/g.10679  ORF Transcript_4190/g.10679 Transcript_4190/m.10679 type:complete len:423 (+) Transcript_4190:1649-2917(+)
MAIVVGISALVLSMIVVVVLTMTTTTTTTTTIGSVAAKNHNHPPMKNNPSKIHYTTSNQPAQSATSWWHHEEPSAALMRQRQQQQQQQQGQVSISWAQTKSLFLVSAIPMVGFGFMDNCVMIQAGQYIDTNLGQALALSTLAAAAFGQVISDVAGVLFGSSLETALKPLLGKNHTTCSSHLTAAQRALPIARYAQTAGAVVGVIIGCLLGASSLLFMDLKVRERQEKLQELTNILQDLQHQHSTTTTSATSINATMPTNSETTTTTTTRKRLTCYMKEMQIGEETQQQLQKQQQQQSSSSSLLQPWIRAPLTAQQCAQANKTIVTELPSSSSSSEIVDANASGATTTLVCTTPLRNKTKDAVVGVLEFTVTTSVPSDADNNGSAELRPASSINNDDNNLQRKLHQQEAELTAQHIAILWNRM